MAQKFKDKPKVKVPTLQDQIEEAEAVLSDIKENFRTIKQSVKAMRAAKHDYQDLIDPESNSHKYAKALVRSVMKGVPKGDGKAIEQQSEQFIEKKIGICQDLFHTRKTMMVQSLLKHDLLMFELSAKVIKLVQLLDEETINPKKK